MLMWALNPNSSTWGLQEGAQDPAVSHVPHVPSSAAWGSGRALGGFIHLFPAALPGLALSLAFSETRLVPSDLSRPLSPLLSLLLGEFNLLALQLCLLLDTLCRSAPCDL